MEQAARETRILIILTTVLAACFFCGALPALVAVNNPGLARWLDRAVPRAAAPATFTATPRPVEGPTITPAGPPEPVEGPTWTPIPPTLPPAEPGRLEPPTLPPAVSTARPVPIPPTPTPIPTFTWTPTPTAAPTPWSISTIPPWPAPVEPVAPPPPPTEVVTDDDGDVDDDGDDDGGGSGLTCGCTNDLDCGDFGNDGNAAQACFEHCQRVTGERDVHDLDRDRDGLACNSLPR